MHGTSEHNQAKVRGRKPVQLQVLQVAIGIGQEGGGFGGLVVAGELFLDHLECAMLTS